ncbi:nuclear polyadenylated RNA-binding protein-like protein Nab2 [Tricladium varicosporioides]|nr:nuclear polyadenylated RNA-binding protein-like protein Nab2 [Hymenoscyphus varicosporioides]
MSVEVVLESPLAHALNAAIQPKLVEVGWSTGGADDSALSEYIILMLVNGKTQDQIAAELSGDLLNLGPDDPGARDFSQWLFGQVEVLNSQMGGGNGGFPQDSAPAQSGPSNEAQDADMGDASETGQSNVPTGPKSMRDGARPRDKRMLGHLAKAMDRSNDNVLHRVRSHGNERINSHARGPPTGPRGQNQNRGGSRVLNGGRNGSMPGTSMHSNAAMNIMTMSPQAQQEMMKNLQILEQQMHGMVNMMGMAGQLPMGNAMGNGFQQTPPGKSLFARVQPNPQRNHNNGFRRGAQAPKFGEHQPHQQQSQGDAPSSSVDVEMSQEKREPPSADTTCKYNLSCTNKDCKFAHQSPAAPPGTTIDISDVCTFGAACKNRKCTGRHPSPAQKIAHQTEMDCRFFPNCTNPKCPFRHPTMPLCRNGADCTTPNCKFTHSKVMCKFNPCLNAACPYKHEEGQKRGKFQDKVWVAGESKEHVSERKFVDENGEEELIKPDDTTMSHENNAATELVT